MESVASSSSADLSALLIGLLKTVLYREDNELQWASLLRMQTRVREYVAVLNLELILDEAEGYAFLKGRPDPEVEDSTVRLPRLITRRQLSYPVSLLLALLRKKLAEFDASGGDTRLILDREEIVELMRVFLADTSNEAKLVDQVDTYINKVTELGFLRKLKASPGGSSTVLSTYEVRRILKAFVDAQWLADFDARLAAYQEYAQGNREENGNG